MLDIETSELKILLPAPKAVVNSVKVLIDASKLNVKLFSEEVNNGSDFELLKKQIFSSADFFRIYKNRYACIIYLTKINS